jgi:hypothetical protein
MRRPEHDHSAAWQKAHAMAANLPRLHNEKAWQRQKVLLCRQWLKAMKGGG